MNIASVLAVTFAIAALLAVFICSWLLIASLFPRFIRQSQVFCASPVKSLLLGLGVGLVPFAIGAALSSSVFGRVLGWPLMVVVLTGALAGTASLATRIGNGMPSQNDRSDPWRRTLRGGVVLSFTFLLPFFGWFVWLPVALVFGTGVTFQTLREFRRLKIAEKELELAENEDATDAKSERLRIEEAVR